MNTLPDQQLLRAYAERRSEPAFAELVRRHVDFVYSAALRMVRDAHLAQDVTQGVFLALAQNASQLGDRPVLSGWLHRTAQNLAANVVRSDVRRRAREQEAVAMNELLAGEPGTVWEHLAPHLDAALSELSEADRDALLLRYFERKSAREMAQTLGTTEDAAQKRVNRAVERLRELFSKRGVTIGAGGLTVLITANAVQAAPVGLSAAVCSAAGFASTTLNTAVAATKAIAMTTLQKTIVAAALAVVAGAGVYEAGQAARLRDQFRQLQQQQAPLSAQVGQLEMERDNLAARLSTRTGDSGGVPSNSDELLRLRGEVTRLRSEADALALEAKKAKAYQSDIAQVLSNTPPIRTYLDTTTTTVPWDQSVLTGGWKTPSGLRSIMLTTPSAGGDGNQVTIKSKLVEYTEAAGKALGLDQFSADAQTSGEAHKLNSDQMNAILKAAEAHDGVNIVGSPTIVTRNGNQAEISVGTMEETPSGEKYSVGPAIAFVPTITPDGQSVRLVIVARANYAIDLPHE